MHPKRKRIRLARDLYRQPGSLVAVTVGTDMRRPVFRREDIARASIDLLAERSSALDVSTVAFCFLPDHLHLLLSPGPNGDLVEFMRDFKSRSTRLCWDHDAHGKIWQRGYYDHILRESEDPLKHIRYILENPVRAGIIESFDAYPWCGSFEYDVMEPEFWESGVSDW